MIIEETIKEVLERRRLEEGRWGFVKFSERLLRFGRNLHRISLDTMRYMGSGTVLGFRANFFDTLGNSFRKLDEIVDEILTSSKFWTRKMAVTDLKGVADDFLRELGFIERKFKAIAEEINIKIDLIRTANPHDPRIGMLDSVEKQMLKNADDVARAKKSIDPAASVEELSERLHQLAYATKHGKETGWWKTQFGGRRAAEAAAGTGATSGAAGGGGAVAGEAAAKAGVLAAVGRYIKNVLISWPFIIWVGTTELIGPLIEHYYPWLGKWVRTKGLLHFLMWLFTAGDVAEDMIVAGGKQTMLKKAHLARQIFFGLIVLKFYEKIGGAAGKVSYEEEIEKLAVDISAIDDEDKKEEIIQGIIEATTLKGDANNIKNMNKDLFNQMFHAGMARFMEKAFGFNIPPGKNGFTRKSSCDELKQGLIQQGKRLHSETGTNAENAKVYCDKGRAVSDNAKAAVINEMFKGFMRDMEQTGKEVQRDLLSKIQ